MNISGKVNEFKPITRGIVSPKVNKSPSIKNSMRSFSIYASPRFTARNDSLEIEQKPNYQIGIKRLSQGLNQIKKSMLVKTEFARHQKDESLYSTY